MIKKILFAIILVSFFSEGFTQNQDILKDTINFHALSWKLNSSNDLEYYPIDTTLNEFQFCSPYFNQSFYNFHLGRILTPSMPAVFIRQNRNFNENLFTSFYDNNFTEPEEIKYYKTRKPYTDIFYTTSGKKYEQQILTFTHTQNVNNNLNVGVKYNLLTTNDTLSSSKITSSSNTFCLWSSFTGFRYNVHANFIYNKLKQNETGGIIDTVENFYYNPTNPFLENASTKISDNYFYVVQEYKLGKTDIQVVNDTTFIENFTEKSILSHTLKFERNYHRFSEEEVNPGFFENIFIDSTKTVDSTYFGKLSNIVQLKSKKYELFGIELNARVSLNNDFYKYYNFKNYFSLNNPDYKSSTYLSVGINNLKLKTFNANFDLKYCLIGYNIADLELNSLLVKNFLMKNDTLSISIKFDYQHKEPAYFIQNYFSNHYSWSNNFKKQKNISLSVNLAKPEQFIDIEFNTTILSDYIYFNLNSIPEQFNSAISINTVYLRKDFYFWKIVMLNKLVYQNITNSDLISLPEFMILNSTFLNTSILKKALDVQLGFDTFFSSDYNAYSYNPALSIFYLSNLNKCGNYPVISPFIKVKLKTALIFFQAEHIGLKMLDNYYFNVNHYHVADYFFRFGVKWWFSN